MVRPGIRTGRGRVIVVACALGVLAGPVAGGAAHADPGPPAPGPGPGGPGPGKADEKGDSKPDKSDGGGRDPDSGPKGSDSDRGRLEDVRKKIEKLHHEVESATEAYNGAEEKVEKQQKAIVDLAKKIDRLQQKQKKMTATAGAMARAQYRAGGMPDEARLMLGGKPEKFLREAGRVRQGQKAARGFLADLGRTRSKLDSYAHDATAEWEDLEENRRDKAAAKKKIGKQLKKAEKAESRLAKDEREQLRALEDAASYKRQAKWLETGALDEIDGKGSKAGKRAIAYATNQIGKDYEWGAEGPKTFDCSGLTLRAWQAAGEEIPRTSQEQWKQLPRVPARKMRPGDLIIFKEDASHVGMYVGEGAMVHAPRTGRQITVEGAGSLPILGVVRPDK